jgi:uncharacterized protein
VKPAVASPCVNVCQMDAATGWCRGWGCGVGEIAGWGGAPEAVQRHILDQLPARRVEMHRHGLWLGPRPHPQEQDR